MGYARERRLSRVNMELTTETWTVSELAARWHFTDESHLIRAYRNRFGETPPAVACERTHLMGRGIKLESAMIGAELHSSTQAGF